MSEPDQGRWFEPLRAILDRSHLWTPDDVTRSVNAALAGLGMRVRIWLIDYEQVLLRALPEPGRETPEPVPIDGSLAGRAFSRVVSVPAGEDGRRRWWVPMVDGTDRLGVIEFATPADADGDERLVRNCEMITGLIGHLIATITQRGDALETARRSRPMSPASELLWRLLPPLTASTDRVVTSAVLEPSYEVGGDGFDYSIDDTTASLLILDAVGHGLRAGLACAVTLAAVRAARLAGGGLYEQARAADAALLEQFPDSRFATAVLAELDLGSGRLRYINAGHPAPLLLRGGRLVRELSAGRRMPLGLDDAAVEIAEETLEPEDRLLFYTDGVTEARARDGDRFGLSRLVDLVRQHEAAGLPAPETLRRLAHAVLDHQVGPPADDATLMLVQWSTPAALNTVPGAGTTTREDQDG
ncbi:PP2C family protein-serine/threonine phosphatase [Actinoplanes sp. NEAU-A12]|uniref:PP2C family protein-serine/threonine phosphatase n=1 Tax=Actinoplanes sandaracinus TaxID=3045177 RepID=A0ABT6WSG2_9ACTN|nr:PP2C family protein-serine/threonine phosphatase [Actinoplanes sandaracinus]MDI6102685.1 PP2C family protein-serine/threonine phosphatase [Actinoplanes sandaracinus]